MLAWPGVAWRGVAWLGLAWLGLARLGEVRFGSTQFGLNRLGLWCVVLCVCCVWLVLVVCGFGCGNHPRANDHDTTTNDNGFWTHGQTTFKPQKTTVISQKTLSNHKKPRSQLCHRFSVTCDGEVSGAISLSTTRVGIFISIDIFMTTVQVSNRTE